MQQKSIYEPHVIRKKQSHTKYVSPYSQKYILSHQKKMGPI